jgi:hypothetical protein
MPYIPDIYTTYIIAILSMALLSAVAIYYFIRNYLISFVVLFLILLASYLFGYMPSYVLGFYTIFMIFVIFYYRYIDTGESGINE